MTQKELKNEMQLAIRGMGDSVDNCCDVASRHAIKEAVEFAKWIEDNNWWGDIDDGETIFDSMRWSQNSASPEYIITEQLFVMYQSTKNL